MWNGAFSPNLRKHRDFQHKTVYAHLMANGGSREIDVRPVKVKYVPVDAKLQTPSETYYFVDIDLAEHGRVYTFLISSEPDNSVPLESRIADEFSSTVENPIEGGRDWWNYLDFDSEETVSHPRVAERLAEGETVPAGPPIHRQPGAIAPGRVDSVLDSLLQ